MRMGLQTIMYVLTVSAVTAAALNPHGTTRFLRRQTMRIVATVRTVSESATAAPVVAASGMKPGDSRQGTIAIGNKGSAAGTLVLRSTGLTGNALAAVIDLEIDDVTGGGATQKWSGKLGSFSSVDLGSLAAGASRDFRITLSWPAASDEASLQGATASLTFQWSGSAKGSGA